MRQWKVPRSSVNSCVPSGLEATSLQPAQSRFPVFCSRPISRMALSASVLASSKAMDLDALSIRDRFAPVHEMEIDAHRASELLRSGAATSVAHAPTVLDDRKDCRQPVAREGASLIEGVGRGSRLILNHRDKRDANLCSREPSLLRIGGNRPGELRRFYRWKHPLRVQVRRSS